MLGAPLRVYDRAHKVTIVKYKIFEKKNCNCENNTLQDQSRFFKKKQCEVPNEAIKSHNEI